NKIICRPSSHIFTHRWKLETYKSAQERQKMENRKTPPPPISNQIIPDELLVSLTSTVCNRGTVGQTDCGIRRPDAVWHHTLGRKKYKYFLEQPTSLSGAGRDISFLCDTVATEKKAAPLPPLTERSGIGDMQNFCVSESLIPEEYHIVKNKGLQSLEFYEDAFTVQLQDNEQKLRSGKVLEVVQLMRMMDDMLEKAGVDRQSEELTELSQMEGLLEMVQVEQNIYNIVFHELIRQVSVGCAERGQLLAKLRQRYQSLLERIPCHLKALHTEVVAQRALDRRLTEEIHRIKTSIQQLSTELAKIRDYDAFVSQQTEHAHQQLAESLDQTHTNSDVVQGYHELYELERGRLEAQLLQMAEERDCWSQLTFCLGLKVISVKKLQLVRRLHVCEQSWFKTAEHCFLYLTSKDTEDLNVIIEFADCWKELLFALMSQLKKTETAQCEQISAIHITVCLQTLALQCEHYQGEKVLGHQQTLAELGPIQESWLNLSLQLFRRHPSSDGEAPDGQWALGELERVLSELLEQLDMQVNGENGIHRQIMSLCGFMESWVCKLGAVIGQPEMMSVPDWLKLEKALCKWQSLIEEVLQNISSRQTENNKNQNKPDIYTETEKVLDTVQEFINSLSSFTDGENQRLSKEVSTSSIHMDQIHWMLDLLLLMVPDHRDDQNPEQEDYYITNISLQTLDENAKILAEKLNYFSRYVTRYQKLVFPWVKTSFKELNYFLRLLMKKHSLFHSFIASIRLYTVVIVLQGELTAHKKPVVNLIGYDGNIIHRELVESTVHLKGTDELVMSPATDEAQKAFSDLTTIGVLQQELYDSELRVQSAEQRALKAEEALQVALEKIQDLERQLEGRPSLEPKILKLPDPPKKTTPETKPSSSTKKTRKH
uniref:Axonemal dynein light chain domain containing 1 n=1 Tax=Mastacembelus armatus TaxID=205130 RepID=A0A3Q3L9S9_9TELE